MNEYFGVIGGSGFYQPTDTFLVKKVKTPFGKVIVYLTDVDERKVAFIPRHGLKHTVPPHLVNYQANIYALHSLGASKVIASSAVGSLVENIHPGNYVVPDQFIDFTTSRARTFFNGKFSVTLKNGKQKKGVVHTDISTPYCQELREMLIDSCKKKKVSLEDKGVYVCTEGPRFETPAEINAYKLLGGTIVGMTSASECILAKELESCYATICLVTNMAAGMQKQISIDEVFTLFQEKSSELKEILFSVIKSSSK